MSAERPSFSPYGAQSETRYKVEGSALTSRSGRLQRSGHSPSNLYLFNRYLAPYFGVKN